MKRKKLGMRLANEFHVGSTAESTPEPCHLCGMPYSVRTFLPLGQMPPGNAFIPPSRIAGEEAFPLDLGFCENCCVVEVMHPAPPSALVRVYRQYSYVPTGTTLRDHYRALAKDIIRTVGPADGSLFVDIGSNDGLLLSSILSENGSYRSVGVEPSTRIAAIARQRGIETINSFFDAKAVEEIRSRFGVPYVVSMTQVLQHIGNPLSLLRRVNGLLDPKGVLVIEGRGYFPDVAEKTSFDTFYHELLFCFTLRSLDYLLRAAGFSEFHVERHAVYGGSLRLYAQKAGGGREVRSSLDIMRADEARKGWDRLEPYQRFGERVRRVGHHITSMVQELKSQGHVIVGYGAPSTGNTLLSYCRLGRDTIDYIVDDNPLKQGLVTPGTHIPITSPDSFERRPPDYVFLLAWRLRDEILRKLEALRGRGLKGVIVPLPNPTVIE